MRFETRFRVLTAFGKRAAIPRMELAIVNIAVCSVCIRKKAKTAVVDHHQRLPLPAPTWVRFETRGAFSLRVVFGWCFVSLDCVLRFETRDAF